TTTIMIVHIDLRVPQFRYPAPEMELSSSTVLSVASETLATVSIPPPCSGLVPPVPLRRHPGRRPNRYGILPRRLSLMLRPLISFALTRPAPRIPARACSLRTPGLFF